ncbi:MAG: recombination regulator RecX [Pseudonocardiales bacterium]|nr:MAG: recombination regulator RecX [Pseudonocardiales bacterium]
MGRRRAAADQASAEPPELADPASAARTICLRLLTTRPRTRAELATALRKRGVPDDCAEAVLTRFGEVGLIDDQAFAAAWVSTRHVGRGLARGALAGELRSRGVAPAIVSAAVDELDTDTELATARQLVARRLPGLRGVRADVRLRRLVGMLARKGYPTGMAVRVVREALIGFAGESVADVELAALETLADL